MGVPDCLLFGGGRKIDCTKYQDFKAGQESEREKYSANFLWPHEDDSIEQLGYEFANARTEEYQKEIWEELTKRIPRITLTGKDTDNPKLCLNGKVIAWVVEEFRHNFDERRYGYRTIDRHKSENFKTKPEAVEAMCQHFGVKGVV
jgi:hypothetical protein